MISSLKISKGFLLGLFVSFIAGFLLSLLLFLFVGNISFRGSILAAFFFAFIMTLFCGIVVQFNLKKVSRASKTP
jgi:hypothetical protein